MRAQVYNYRPDTGEFTIAGELEYDPLLGEPMIPSFATTIEPLPSKDGFTVNFINNAWVYLEIPREKPEQPQEPYYVFDEVSWSWVIDEKVKAEYELQQRIAELKKLLADSDYKETPSYMAGKTDEENTAIFNQRIAWREEVRELES